MAKSATRADGGLRRPAGALRAEAELPLRRGGAGRRRERLQLRAGAAGEQLCLFELQLRNNLILFTFSANFN